MSERKPVLDAKSSVSMLVKRRKSVVCLNKCDVLSIVEVSFFSASVMKKMDFSVKH